MLVIITYYKSYNQISMLLIFMVCQSPLPAVENLVICFYAILKYHQTIFLNILLSPPNRVSSVLLLKALIKIISMLCELFFYTVLASIFIRYRSIEKVILRGFSVCI